ncbi:MAG: energy transducer TonB [Deltaproteobacteria bacterium]|nr:energy transducer TonB [Deltaproteobacteria bacterium]MBW1961717.1 energy transducer TonB [Deltaproteobacteria bacterium]MBW2153781.1 energy transducer TonB [Deltaproteobacteria bacterium]
MKNMLIAGFIALAVHGMLFLLDVRWKPVDYRCQLPQTIFIRLETSTQAENTTSEKTGIKRRKFSVPEPAYTRIRPAKRIITRIKPKDQNKKPPKPKRVQPPVQRKPKPQKQPGRLPEETILSEFFEASADLPVGIKKPGLENVSGHVFETSSVNSLSGKSSEVFKTRKEGLKSGELKSAIPDYRKNPPPVYPRAARRRGLQGRVVLEVLVDTRGRVKDLKVFSSSGHSILDKAAVAAVKKWLFKPAVKGDQKVEMWVRVPIRFALK